MDMRALIEQELAQRGYVAEELESPIRAEAGGEWAVKARVAETHKSADEALRIFSFRASSGDAVLDYVRSLPSRM
jgi:hypothetical protein